MRGSKSLLFLGVAISIIFVIVGCVWLSISAETLDKVAEHFGASEMEVWNPPIPDYELPGLEGNLLANITVGVAFTLLTLGVTFAVGKVLRAKK